MDCDVQHLDCNISKDDLKDGVAKIVRVLRPEWNVEEVKIEDKSTGYINSNYAVNQPSGLDGIFVRIVNTSLDTQLERATNSMRYLKTQKLGAQLLLTFNNGLVMEFLEGEVVTWETIQKVREPEVWLSIARETARYHAATDWENIKKYNIPDMRDLSEKYDQILTDLYYSGKVPDEHKKGLPNPETMKELKTKITESLIKVGAERSFCHTDSNPTNLLIQNGKDIVFVDYDDCTVDFSCVEISRFFGTLCGVLDCDFSKLPTPEQEDAFLREYLEHRSLLQPERGAVTEKMVDYWKFLMRKSIPLTWVGGTVAVMFLSQVSDKPLDPNLGHKFWDRYLTTEESAMAETFEWD